MYYYKKFLKAIQRTSCEKQHETQFNKVLNKNKNNSLYNNTNKQQNHIPLSRPPAAAESFTHPHTQPERRQKGPFVCEKVCVARPKAE